MIHTFGFSPTGGTQKALDAVVQGFQGPAVPHDLCDRELDFFAVEISRADCCLFAVPSFGGRTARTGRNCRRLAEGSRQACARRIRVRRFGCRGTAPIGRHTAAPNRKQEGRASNAACVPENVR